MEVILIDKIKNLGDVGDLVKVRPGYARNYLIPYGKAKFATEQNRLEIEQRRAEYEKHVSEERAQAKERADKLQDLELTHTVQAMEDGRLYGPVSIADVCDLVSQKSGVEIQKQEINFPEGQIRTVGSHPIIFHLHSDVQVRTQLQVVAAQQTGSDKDTEQEQQEGEAPQQTPDIANTDGD
ncbi:MAG: 50S ribosomal protein L9 [Gammaproteobacteria bacterium]|nr:50S ribosomal protein L9 [Gammaproteobacteria bacterium]